MIDFDFHDKMQRRLEVLDDWLGFTIDERLWKRFLKTKRPNFIIESFVTSEAKSLQYINFENDLLKFLLYR